jgi:hypothetical protein
MWLPTLEMERIAHASGAIPRGGETPSDGGIHKDRMDSVRGIQGSKERHAALQLCLLHGFDQGSRYRQGT